MAVQEGQKIAYYAVRQDNLLRFPERSKAGVHRIFRENLHPGNPYIQALRKLFSTILVEIVMSVHRPLERLVALMTTLFLVSCSAVYTQDSNKSLLNLERIFSSREFRAQPFGPARWMKDGGSYTTLEKSEKTKGGQDIVLYPFSCRRQS
jgi:hypothetical protein